MKDRPSACEKEGNHTRLRHHKKKNRKMCKRRTLPLKISRRASVHGIRDASHRSDFTAQENGKTRCALLKLNSSHNDRGKTCFVAAVKHCAVLVRAAVAIEMSTSRMFFAHW